jgi:hypothetical protein
VTTVLRRLGTWLLALAERLDQRALQCATDDPWHDALAQRRVFELRTRIHAGYY